MNTLLLGGKISRYVIIDESDYDRLSMYSWCYDGNGYAVTRVVGESNLIYMHKMVLGLVGKIDKIVDHINHDTLDNRKENLRLATASQSVANRRHYGKKSKYKGVRPKGVRWEANITYDKRQKYLGVFDSEEEAAMVYDTSARKVFGVFAKTNFMCGDE